MRALLRRGIVAAVAIAATVTMVGTVRCGALDRDPLAGMLNIAQAPASVSELSCTSYGFTDDLERCAFRIAPADFDALLRGYAFVEPAPCMANSPVGFKCADPTWRRTSHSYGGGPVIGQDFAVAHVYVATPEKFKNRGNVAVLVDRSRSFVLVDLYIE